MGFKIWLFKCYFWFQNFEDFIVGHFLVWAHDILGACKAYMEGAQVGYWVKREVHEVDRHFKSYTEQFKISLRDPMEKLASEFARIGAMNWNFLDAKKIFSMKTLNLRLDSKVLLHLLQLLVSQYLVYFCSTNVYCGGNLRFIATRHSPTFSFLSYLQLVTTPLPSSTILVVCDILEEEDLFVDWKQNVASKNQVGPVNNSSNIKQVCKIM